MVSVIEERVSLRTYGQGHKLSLWLCIIISLVNLPSVPVHNFLVTIDKHPCLLINVLNSNWPTTLIPYIGVVVNNCV